MAGHELGNPDEVMKLDEVEHPTPGPGQVLVRVRAAALNFPDVLMAQGLYQERPPLPYTPGIELCGEIVETGQRVLGSPSGGPGAFAEYALMDADAAWPVPEGMPDEKAAALYLTYQTGYVGLHRRAHLQAGEVLLVHAGAGGGGSAGGRGRPGGDPAGQVRRRHGHRHRRRRAQGRGLPLTRRRPRDRLHQRGLR